MKRPTINELVDLSQQSLFSLVESQPLPKPIFILGAPRTGSTLLFQMILKCFRFPYFNNFTNIYFPGSPVLGALVSGITPSEIKLTSNYGKTDGIFQPSEASAIMKYWFGGGHPSQSVSYKIKEGREQHFLSTLKVLEWVNDGQPLVMKNAWNCFRLDYLTKTLPEAKFIWIKRDIRDAARSDLSARIKTKGDMNKWNSATPDNYNELLKLDSRIQVIENQFEFNRVIFEIEQSLTKKVFFSIWYEEIVMNKYSSLKKIAEFLNKDITKIDEIALPIEKGDHWRKSNTSNDLIDEYVGINQARFYPYLYETTR